jgi:hypothetical protein
LSTAPYGLGLCAVLATASREVLHSSQSTLTHSPASLQVAAHATPPAGDDDTDPEAGLRGPLRHLLIDSDNPTELVDLLLDTAHRALAALPAMGAQAAKEARAEESGVRCV